MKKATRKAAQSGALRRKPHLEIAEGSGVFHVRVVGANGEIILSSETYQDRANADRSAKHLSEQLGLKVKKGNA